MKLAFLRLLQRQLEKRHILKFRFLDGGCESDFQEEKRFLTSECSQISNIILKMEGENVKKYLVLGNLLIRHKENFWFIYRLLEIFSAAEEFSYFSIKKNP